MVSLYKCLMCLLINIVSYVVKSIDLDTIMVMNIIINSFR